MAESQKGSSSNTDSEKKNPLFEDDNAQDFLNSWKPTAGGKDILDLSIDAVPRERKKAFDFDKLDDFELNPDFGKISSFKMDMSDLDFSSPQKKQEKSKERPRKETVPGKLEGRTDHFSFSFDFNELDAFDLDTNLLKGDRKPKKSVESDMLDIFENDMNLPKLGGTNGSNSKDLISSKLELEIPSIITGASSAGIEQRDMSHEAPTSPEKQITTDQGSNDEVDNAKAKGDMVEPVLTTGSKKPNVEKHLQDFCVQSSDSTNETTQQSQTADLPLVTVDANVGEEKDNTSTGSEDHSQLGTDSPTKVCDSNCLSALCIKESMSTDNEPTENRVDKRNVTSLELSKVKKYVQDNSLGTVLHKTLPGIRNNEDKQSSRYNVPQSSLCRDSKYEKFVAMKENGSSGLQLLPLHKSHATVSRLSSATTGKQLYGICNKKMETMSLHPANEKSEHSGEDKQGGTRNEGILRSLDRSPKVGLVAVGSDINIKDSNISTGSGIQKPVPSTETISITKVTSVEHQEISLENADKRFDLSNTNTSRITTSNKFSPNSARKETNLLGHLKKNMVEHLKASPVAAHSATIKKSPVFSPPLKRKSIEGSHLDLSTSNSSKRILVSPGKRKSLQISPRIHGQVDPGGEVTGGLHGDLSLNHQSSRVGIHVEGRDMDFEILLTVENDGNIEKAEACTKELENICNMLKKKNEEAKELLLRAIINNNSLLMLDHPMYEEKILELQRFAAALFLKKYDA